MLSFYKKFIVVALIFALISSFLVPFFSTAVFAEDNSDFCDQVRQVSCEEPQKLNEFSSKSDTIQKECGNSVLNDFQNKVNKCKADLENQKAQTESQWKTLEKQESAAERTLGNLNWNIKKLNTEIASLNLSLAELESAIQEREKAIKELDDALAKHKAILAEAIRQVYEYNTLSYIEIILGYGTLSDFNQKLEEIDRLQVSLKSSMEEISKAKQQMEQEKAELLKKKEQQEQYKTMQEMSKQSLATKQQQQQYLLEKLAAAKTPLEKEMARIQAELISLRSAMKQIQNYLFRSLGYYVSPEDIFNAVDMASKQTGVSPEIFLAILQHEGSVNNELYNKGSREANIQQCVDMCRYFIYGTCCPAARSYRIGSSDCRYNGDFGRGAYCTHQQDALERICNNLVIDPNDVNKVKITKDYGMGPAQIQPTTYEGKGFTGNPWNLNWAVWAIAGLYQSGNYGYVGDASFQGMVQEWQSVISVCGFSLSCPDLKSKLEEIFHAR